MPSASPTAAFLDFRHNLEYAKQMVESARLLSGLQVASLDVDDLYRAAWVQAVAALDHWVHEEIYCRAVIIGQYPGMARPRRFREFEIPMRIHDAISSGIAPFDVTFRSHLKEKLGYRSYQNPVNIRDGFRLVSDVDLWNEVAKILSTERADGTQITAQDVMMEFSRIATRRNKIAHEADRDPADPSAKADISAADVDVVITWLETAVAAILLALGDTEPPTTGPAAMRRQTQLRIAEQERADRFEGLLEQHQTEAVSVRLILDQWVRLGGWIAYGEHDETIAFAILSGETADYWPISIYPVAGKIAIMLEDMSRLEPFNDIDVRRDLLEQINEIPGVALRDEALSQRPSFRISALQGQGAARLWDALQWFAAQVPHN